MNQAEHKARHEALHKSLDELLADFIMHNPGKRLRETSLMDFLQWSASQMANPSVNAEGEHAIRYQPPEPENPQDKIFALEKRVRELEEERDSIAETRDQLLGEINEHD
jgi:hypothetical protein